VIVFLAVSGVLFWLLIAVSVWLVVVAIVRGVKQVRADRTRVDARIDAVAQVGAADIERFLKGGGER